MTTRTICFIFATTLAVAAVANAELESEDDAFNEATSFVQTFIAENQGGETACMKVATDSIQTIKNECANLQSTVDKAAKKNQACCTEGNGAVCTAKMQHYTNQQIVGSCKRELNEMKKTPVSFASYSFKDLTEDKCGNFYSGKSFQKIHKKVNKKKNECTKASGAASASERALAFAVTNAATNREKCNKKFKTALDKAYKTAVASCNSATNKKAYQRAMHMKCVLAGKALKDCKVSGAPKVTMIEQSKLKCAAQTGEFYDEPSGTASVSKSITDTKCQFKMENPHRRQPGYSTHNYSPWVTCMAKTGNGNEKIRGFRLNTYNKNIGYLMYEPPTNTNANIWDKSKYYLCPRGWHWATQKEFNAACTQASGYVGYRRCGATEYRNINSYGSYWVTRTYWRFSTSRVGQDGESYYAHSGHGECTGPNFSSSTSNFAGIICMRD